MKKEVEFWKWFIKHKDEYTNLDKFDVDEKENKLDTFLDHLHKYNENLFFQLGSDNENSQNELIITAEGETNYFDHVRQLVNSAPQINKWNIVAFKQPMGVDFTTRYEGLLLDPRKIWFLPLVNTKNPKELGLRVCVPNYNSNEEQLYQEAVFQVLDTVVGEEVLAINIQYVEVDYLSENPEKEGLMQLSDLPAYIKWETAKTKS